MSVWHRMEPKQRATAEAFARSLAEGARCLAATMEAKREWDAAQDRLWIEETCDAEIVARRARVAVLTEQQEELVLARRYRRMRQEAREQKARQARFRQSAGRWRADLRRVRQEQQANLLQYSELSFAAIADRMRISAQTIHRFQEARRIKRPLSVRGKRGYDLLRHREEYP